MDDSCCSKGKFRGFLNWNCNNFLRCNYSSPGLSFPWIPHNFLASPTIVAPCTICDNVISPAFFFRIHSVGSLPCRNNVVHHLCLYVAPPSHGRGGNLSAELIQTIARYPGRLGRRGRGLYGLARLHHAAATR